METINKEIRITRNSLVTDIQQAFTLFYPFFKIEFSKNEKEHPSKSYKVNSESSIGKITTITAAAELNVDDDRTVAEVEKDCRELFGLSIQVFRKSGNVWNVISLTNSWTLRSQNMAGEFISTEMSAAS